MHEKLFKHLEMSNSRNSDSFTWRNVNGSWSFRTWNARCASWSIVTFRKSLRFFVLVTDFGSSWVDWTRSEANKKHFAPCWATEVAILVAWKFSLSNIRKQFRKLLNSTNLSLTNMREKSHHWIAVAQFSYQFKCDSLTENLLLNFQQTLNKRDH